MQLTEGTHYMRREIQPSPAPHRSKEAVDCMLCSDPGDDDNAHVGHVHRKRSRATGQNIWLDRQHAHMKSFHPDACRFGAKSLLQFGFTMRGVGAATTSVEGLNGMGIASPPPGYCCSFTFRKCTFGCVI